MIINSKDIYQYQLCRQPYLTMNLTDDSAFNMKSQFNQFKGNFEYYLKLQRVVSSKMMFT